MQERHLDKNIYFKEQEYTTQKYVIPYVNEFLEVNSNINVLEIGCGEAGNLKPFLDMGCMCVGVDMNATRINYYREHFADHPNNKNLTLIVEDIYNMVDELKEGFDLIILRDVIEHIHNHNPMNSSILQIQPLCQILEDIHMSHCFHLHHLCNLFQNHILDFAEYIFHLIYIEIMVCKD